MQQMTVCPSWIEDCVLFESDTRQAHGVSCRVEADVHAVLVPLFGRSAEMSDGVEGLEYEDTFQGLMGSDA